MGSQCLVFVLVIKDGVNRALNERGMSVGQGRMIVCDRSEWRAVENA